MLCFFLFLASLIGAVALQFHKWSNLQCLSSSVPVTLKDVCEDTTYSSFFHPILIQNHFIWMPWLKPLQTQMFLFCEWGVSLRSEQLWRTSAVWCFIHWRQAVVCSSLGTRINYYLQLPRFIDVPDIINNSQLERAYYRSALCFGLFL